jgi:hypothetical protein
MGSRPPDRDHHLQELGAGYWASDPAHEKAVKADYPALRAKARAPPTGFYTSPRKG